MFEMMKQAMSMQRELKTIQKGLAKKTVEYAAKGGLVKAVARCDMSVESVKIDPQMMNPADAAKLEDAVASAVNGALNAAKQEAAKEMSKMTGGMGGMAEMLGLR
jgi:DNA-binding YbaB/EbfC family protein